MCGTSATAELSEKIGDREVTCHPRTKDRYGRTVATCFDADADDLGSWLVRSGWATAARKYSTVYVADEDSARHAKRGLWAGTFVDPEQWRHGVRVPPQQ